MNPNLLAALADDRIRETRHQTGHHHPRSPRSAPRPCSHPRGRVRLQRRIGITLVETGLYLLANTPVVRGQLFAVR